VSRAALDVIYAHARREYPDECCGVVYGPRRQRTANHAVCCKNIQNRLHAIDPARNLRTARSAYTLETRAVVELQASLRGETPAKIVYHSHVDVGAYFSVADQEGALFDGEPAYPVEYLVVDVTAGRPCTARQYAWDPEQRAYVEVLAYTAGLSERALLRQRGAPKIDDRERPEARHEIAASAEWRHEAGNEAKDH
jgi:proteasome lid subunit RPN8/RPN11